MRIEVKDIGRVDSGRLNGPMWLASVRVDGGTVGEAIRAIESQHSKAYMLMEEENKGLKEEIGELAAKNADMKRRFKVERNQFGEDFEKLEAENERLRQALKEFEDADWKNKNERLKVEILTLRNQLTDLGNTITKALNNTDYVPF